MEAHTSYQTIIISNPCVGNLETGDSDMNLNKKELLPPSHASGDH